MPSLVLSPSRPSAAVCSYHALTEGQRGQGQGQGQGAGAGHALTEGQRSQSQVQGGTEPGRQGRNVHLSRAVTVNTSLRFRSKAPPFSFVFPWSRTTRPLFPSFSTLAP